MTLVEVLMALIITSVVITLLTQALYQVLRIERSINETQPDAVRQALRAAQIRLLVKGVVARRVEDAGHFRGKDYEFNGSSVAVPSIAGPAAGEFRLSLVKMSSLSGQPGYTELRLRSTFASDESVLLRWPGQGGNLRYLNASGQWVSDWAPSPDGLPPTLPRAVAIETPLEGVRTLVIPLVATPGVPIARRDVDRL